MQYTCARNCVRELCSSPACNPIKLVVKVATCRRLDETLVKRGLAQTRETTSQIQMLLLARHDVAAQLSDREWRKVGTVG